MAKTKPIGVRFDEELLGKLKERGITTAQKALILYEAAYKKEMSATWELGQKLINAASGRPSGIGNPVADVAVSEIWEEDTKRQIKDLERSLSMNQYPKHIQSEIAKKVWKLEQQKVINQLKSSLK